MQVYMCLIQLNFTFDLDVKGLLQYMGQVEIIDSVVIFYGLNMYIYIL